MDDQHPIVEPVRAAIEDAYLRYSCHRLEAAAAALAAVQYVRENPQVLDELADKTLVI